MVKENMYDKVTDLLHERSNVVKTKLAKQFGKTNPYRMKPVDKDMHRYIYENMSMDDFDYAVGAYGIDGVQDWVLEMEQLRRNK